MLARCLRRMAWLVGALTIFSASQVLAKGLAQEDYLIGGGDTLSIIVYDQPDLRTEARVSQDDGTVTFPLLGEVVVTGLSPAAAGNKIAEQLRKGGFIKDPQVSVTVTEFQSQKVPVMGQVNNPGEYSLKGESRVIGLITQAGGLKPDAADVVIVVKEEAGKTIKHEIDLLKFYAGDMSQNIAVQRGDFVLVPKMDSFYIYGEVRSPGMYRLERGMTVMQAVSVAGGVSERGSLKSIRVTRKAVNGEVKEQKVGLEDQLQSNDVLFVKERLF